MKSFLLYSKARLISMCELDNPDREREKVA